MARIIVVDDDEELISVMQICLDAAGHTVDCAPEPSEAEILIAQNHYDLLVVDWDMPNTPGVEFVKHLRFKGFNQPILMVTGHASDDDRELSVDCGADDYLVKPFGIKEFMVRVKALLRRVDKYEFKIAPGACLGHTELEHMLGQGGMGLVWKGYDKSRRESVAIKFLDMPLVDESYYRKRFQAEAAVLDKLNHPNLVKLIDFGVTPGKQPYIVMEYLDGLGLVEYLWREGNPTIKEIVDIALQICVPLEAIHQQGIIHRDLKPSNILVCQQASGIPLVKLVDFGVAKEFNKKTDEPSKQLTVAGEFFGTAWFMSPEQGFERPLDQRSDIYSFASLVYYLICRQPLFDAESAFETLAKHMTEKPTPMEQRTPGLDIAPGLDAIVMKCLEKEPDKRFQSIESLAEAIRTVHQSA